MKIIQTFFLFIYLLTQSKFPVLIAQIADNTANNNNNGVTASPTIVNVTNQQTIENFKLKGNLTCIHFNYDLIMTLFNSTGDIEDFMATSTHVMCLWKKINGSFQTEPRAFTDVRRIEIRNSTIFKIPNKMFVNFSKLVIFRARDVKLQEVHQNDFASADYLYFLDLSKNEIKKLENGLFMNLKGIKEIDMSSNKIEIIDDAAFNGMGINLTRIDLSNNKIKAFKEDFFLTMISNITRKWLPFDINLRNNQIEVIESSSRNATILPEINLQLSGNKLNSLELLKIELFEIVLRNFTLENLNVNASYVYADNNKLKTYRVKGKTRVLSLQNNLISSLTYDDYLSVTRNVFLSGNNLSCDAVADLLKKVVNLEILDISNNPIKSLNIDMFSELLLLQKLILSNTSLTELPFGVFSHQLGLKVLDVSGNNLSNIDFHLFSSNTNLEVLDISGTNISQVKDCKKIGEILPKLKLLGVDGNNWKCTALSKLKVCLNTQLIKLMLPDQPTKNQSNVMGVKCIYDQNDTISTTPASITSTISVDNYVNEIMDKIHELDVKIVSTKPLEQKGITMLELILSILLSICGTLLGLFAFNKVKDYLKINRFRMPRMSRRGSPDTIVTYDSNMVRNKNFYKYERLLGALSTFFGPTFLYLYAIPILSAINIKLYKKLMIALLASDFINALLKWILNEDRPYWFVHEASGYTDLTRPILYQTERTCETSGGSPSGHMMLSSCFMFVLYDEINAQIDSNVSQAYRIQLRILNRFIVIGTLTLVAISRMYFSAHFLHQCILGCVIGILVSKLASSDVYTDNILKYRKRDWLMITVAMTIAVVTIYWGHKVISGNPMKTVHLAFKHCSNPLFPSPETTVVFSALRCIAITCGLMLSAPLEKRSIKLNFKRSILMTPVLIALQSYAISYTPKTYKIIIFYSYTFVTYALFQFLYLYLISKYCVKKDPKKDKEN
ncbi:uncharacterized protein [Chironomus tepperi]|uniref:uncharacterized protein n=1 Tax=Chironomus tepperi TaxID=113505 RepID=UPI00391F0809